MLGAVCHGKKDLRIEPVEVRALSADEVRVDVSYGGICGSDLHYFHRGAVGDFAVREPMTLGHEISGRVAEVGSQVNGLRVGMKVALDPSRACHVCDYCLHGRFNLCVNMFFLGSAGRFPHVQGGFAQQLVLRKDQVIPVPDETDLLKLSCAEPLSVALHAVNRAGSLLGKRVIVTGSGPIGLLSARAAKYAGAVEVLATDVEDAPLAIASRKMGADRVVNIAKEPSGLDEYEKAGGYFDVAIEASGSPAALASLFRIVRRGGRIVQLGMLPPGTAPIPVNVIQSREIDLIGAFRASGEFRTAVELIISNAIDVSPILSGVYPLKDASSAFELAGDRTKVVKLHLELNRELA